MMSRVVAALVLAACALGFSAPAFAKWHKAESDRFVIYSDSRADDLEEFGEMLERYHVALELESGRQVAVPSPSNRLTVYMVGSRDDLRDVYGAGGRSAVAGFYIPRANGSVTFVPNINLRSRDNSRGRTGTRYSRSSGAGEVDFSLTVLLHEYAHHFLIASSRHAMPRWLSEGAAEYFASARFNPDGSVDIGLPNNNRAYEISQAAPVPLSALLDYEEYRSVRSGRYDAYYGRSWLLYHYLRFAPDRPGQLVRYWQAVATGADSTQAAEQIFGDLDRLESQLRDYGRQTTMAGMRFSAGDIVIGEVEVTALSNGHAAMMDVIIRSDRGVSGDEAAEIAGSARQIAARYPNDAHVLAALAEAEFDAGNDDAAIDAATAAIAADPAITNAYVQKGYALFRKADNAEGDDARSAAYAAAMAPFEALNAIEADHTQPLIHFYRSFVQQGIAPPDGAKFALERATQLAPFDQSLAVEVAAMKAYDGDPVVARYLLAPVAANPHGGSRSQFAQAMMDYLADIPDGTSVNLRRQREQFDAANEAGEEGPEEGPEESPEESSA